MREIKRKSSKLVDWELYEAIPQVYVVRVEDSYQRAMLFLRYQEHYESPYNKFQGKSFNIFEFMDHYRKDRGACAFLYPSEWSGYNIPSSSLLKCYVEVKDNNPYDEAMGEIIIKISEELLAGKAPGQKAPKFYLIGVDKIEGGVMDHEIAHALFFIDPQYRKKATDLVSKLAPRKREKMEKILLGLGYRPQVLVDEIQAFMSTGLWPGMAKVVTEKDCKPFIENWLDTSLACSPDFKR
jgi:hypothetical protein